MRFWDILYTHTYTWWKKTLKWSKIFHGAIFLTCFVIQRSFCKWLHICIWYKQLASMGIEPMTLALLAPRSRPSELTGHVNSEDQLHLLFQCSFCTGWTTVEVQYNLVNDSPCIFEIFGTHTHTHGEKKLKWSEIFHAAIFLPCFMIQRSFCKWLHCTPLNLRREK